jgi:TPR repeat protein
MAACSAYGPSGRARDSARSRAASPRCRRSPSQRERSWSRSRIGAPAASSRPAAALFEKGCEGGDPAGCAHFGDRLARGLGVEKDAARAAKYYQRACDAGEARACKSVGKR